MFSVLHVPEGRQVLRHRVEEGPVQRDYGRVWRLRRESAIQGKLECIYFDDENQIFGDAVIN